MPSEIGNQLHEALLHDLRSHKGPVVTTTIAIASWAYDEIARLHQIESDQRGE